jgi:hypothetical protein
MRVTTRVSANADDDERERGSHNNKSGSDESDADD